MVAGSKNIFNLEFIYPNLYNTISDSGCFLPVEDKRVG